MVNAIQIVTFVYVAFRIRLHALTFFLIDPELANVSSAIFFDLLSLPMHNVVIEFAFVRETILHVEELPLPVSLS